MQITNEPSDGQPEFSAEVQDAFRQMRLRRSPCPDSAQLEAFQRNALSAAEAEPIRLHVSECGICDAVLERLKHYDRAERSVSAGVLRRAASWLFLSPAVAWLVVLLLVYPAYVGLHPITPAPQPGPATAGHATEARLPAVRHELAGLISAKTFDLRQVRGKTGAGARRVELQPEERAFILSFWLEIKDGERYTASIAAPDGRPIITNQQALPNDKIGNFFLVCDRRLFPSPGVYTLRLQGDGPQWQIPFELKF